MILICAFPEFPGFVATVIRGFVNLKKSGQNSEVGGWVKSQLGFFFFLEMFWFYCFLCCFLLLYMFQKKMVREEGV